MFYLQIISVISFKEINLKCLSPGSIRIKTSLWVRYCYFGPCYGCNNFALRTPIMSKIRRDVFSLSRRKIVLYEVNREYVHKGPKHQKFALIALLVRLAITTLVVSFCHIGDN